jgi:hypothetical protein
MPQAAALAPEALCESSTCQCYGSSAAPLAEYLSLEWWFALVEGPREPELFPVILTGGPEIETNSCGSVASSVALPRCRNGAATRPNRPHDRGKRSNATYARSVFTLLPRAP